MTSGVSAQGRKGSDLGARRALIGFACAFALLAAPAAHAAETPAPGRTDPRLRTFTYDPEQVVRLKGFFGYQMVLEFGEDERMENVSIGDSQGWQVTPNRRADRLFLKPFARATATNMAVLTNLRSYAFELSAAPPAGPNDPELIFRLRFRYPEEEAAKLAATARAKAPAVAAAPALLNTGYRFSGAPALAPVHVFDDGQATRFTWRHASQTPAIYALNAAGEESVVNYRVEGDELVVQQLAPAFVLRIGKAVAWVRNDGYGLAPPPGQLPASARWTSLGDAR